MSDQPMALFSYPGLNGGYESVDVTDVLGTAPAKITVKVLASLVEPALTGDAVFTMGSNSVTFPNCRLVDVFYEPGTMGQVATIHLHDERWAFNVGYVISGIYNLRLPDNQVDATERQKSIFQLAQLLFGAMGVTNYDASLLQTAGFTGLRPYVNWDVSNPAQELQKLLDDNGLALAPKRSTNTWVIVQLGIGAQLPPLDGSIPFQDLGLGIDPKEVPDIICVYGSPIRYQVRLLLESVGKDILDPSNPNADGKWKPINQLSYIPYNSDLLVYTWDFEDDEMGGVSNERIQQPDGSYQVARDLARSTVFRCYRVAADDNGNIRIPQYVNPVDGSENCTLDQLIFRSELVDAYVDADGTRFVKPAFCDFIGTHNLIDDTGTNTTPGTRLEIQKETEPDAPSDFVTFSINADNVPFHLLTSPHGIVTFSQALKRYSTLDYGPEETDEPYLPAIVALTTCVQVRDPNTWQPTRYTKQVQVPGNTDPNSLFVMPIRQDDIQQWYKMAYARYDPDTGQGRSPIPTNNLSFVDPQADYYLNSTLASLTVPDTQTVTYQGIFPIDLDGAILQVSYVISTTGGADTKASRGTEHDWKIDSYRDRLNRIARSGAANADLQNTIKQIKANIPTIP